MGKDEENIRHSLIHLIQVGHSPEQAATELAHSPSWAYKWWGRFNESGWEGLKSQSRAPHHHPNRISGKTVKKILEFRRDLEREAQQPGRLTYIGAHAIRGRMLELCLPEIPSPSTIEKTLRQAGATKPRPALSESKIVYPHLSVTQPHQLTQMDIVPHYLLGGMLVNCFNAIDVVSRYPAGKQYESKATRQVLDFCLDVFREAGIPEYLQMDNESSFNGGRTHPYVIGKVPRLMLLVGTELVYSPYYHPESNAYVERFHQDYTKNVWEKTRMNGLPQVRRTSTTFFGRYRISRHHSELRGRSPAAVHFETPLRALPKNFALPQPLPITEGNIHFMRAVSKDQTISIFNVNWPTGLAQPHQGVWATLSLTVREARLFIYDQAPDASNRCCLANHPFPLSEPVVPLSAEFQKQNAHGLRKFFRRNPIYSTMSSRLFGY